MEKNQALEKLQSANLAELHELKGMAQLFAQSGLFEDVKDASQAFVKIIKGKELGLQPVQAMEAFDIIQKRLFVKPRTIGALINSCGYGAYRPLERSEKRCAILFSRRTREGWIDLPEVEYTIETAQAQGLVSRSPQWKTDPANMLFWRCLGRGGSQYFPELLAGLAPIPDFATEPVSDEKAQENISDLFGDPPQRRVPDMVQSVNTPDDAQNGSESQNALEGESRDAETNTSDSDASTVYIDLNNSVHDLGNKLNGEAIRKHKAYKEWSAKLEQIRADMNNKADNAELMSECLSTVLAMIDAVDAALVEVQEQGSLV